MSLISPELIALFNQAAGLAREGRFEESLKVWDQLLGPQKQDPDQRLVLTGDFLGQATMRKAWVLMDLERYAEARDVLGSDVMQACLGQFELKVLYEYFFSFGNVLGTLGDIAGMDDKFSRAMGIAAEELGDYPKVRQCWLNLLDHALQHKAWKYILRESDACRSLAENYADKELAAAAMKARDQAQKEIKSN